MIDLLRDIEQSLLDGNAERAKLKTETALYTGINPDDIIKKSLIPAMDKIGRDFKMGELYIPDVLMSSRAMHASLYVLKPLLVRYNDRKKGLIVIGTVAGDLHDLGKNMISMSLQGDGYEVIDLGIDVMSSSFMNAIDEYNPDIIAISALLTTTMGEIKRIIEDISNSGKRPTVKVIVGGGPLTDEYAEKIGADGYGKDLSEALDLVNRLLGKKAGYFNV